MRTKEEQDAINKACKYHPKTKQELIKLVNDKRIYLGNIDTSAITDMSNLFSIIKDSRYIENNREEFTGIEDWDTSNVTKMDGMFAWCKKFNRPLNDWNVSKVSNMQAMFLRCYRFNQDISSWDVSSVKNMDSMFNNAWNFNQDFEGWNVREDCLTNDIFKHMEHLEFKYFYESFTQDQIFKSGKSNIDPHFFRMTKEAFVRYSSVESYGPLNANNIDKKSFRRS